MIQLSCVQQKWINPFPRRGGKVLVWCLLFSLTSHDLNIMICYVNNCMSGTRGYVNLLKQWNNIGTSATTQVTTWLSLQGNGSPLQFSCLENSMDGGAWQATVHRVTKSQTQLSNLPLTQACNNLLSFSKIICLLHRPNRKAECGWNGNHYPFIF